MIFSSVDFGYQDGTNHIFVYFPAILFISQKFFIEKLGGNMLFLFCQHQKVKQDSKKRRRPFKFAVSTLYIHRVCDCKTTTTTTTATVYFNEVVFPSVLGLTSPMAFPQHSPPPSPVPSIFPTKSLLSHIFFQHFSPSLLGPTFHSITIYLQCLNSLYPTQLICLLNMTKLSARKEVGPKPLRLKI